MAMIALITENAPPRLRGRLSLLLLEVKAGVYLGVANPKTRAALWQKVKEHLGDGSAVLAWPDPSHVSGVDFDTAGINRRTYTILDGLKLVQFNPVALPDTVPNSSVEIEALKNLFEFKEIQEESTP